MDGWFHWLAYPQALWLLTAMPLLGFGALWAWWTRRRSWRLLGSLQTRSPLAASPIGRRLLRGSLIGSGLLLVGLAAAGPRWGREKTEVVSAARDLVVVLDVSRSMLAETPSRQLRAQRVLSDLAETLKQRGGHRVALVVVAAKAQLVMPLTTDYDLFQMAVKQQDAARLPAELRPGKDGPSSGTRLGVGLIQAVAAQSPDPRHRGSQVILLVSDGDDPADDGEWKEGAAAARRAGVPVFAVGVGNPEKPSHIRIGDTLLTFGDRPVETTLNEEVLKEIARSTDGAYFKVGTENVVPGELFAAVLAAASALPRETPPAEDYSKQFRWFLTAGLALLVASLLVRDRWPAPAKTDEGDKDMRRIFADSPARPLPMTVAASLALAALVLAGAAPDLENLLRQANEAFQNKDYAAALKFYEQAEPLAADPGLVAFNKGAALIRLGRHREAELCYLRCLQDRAAPAQRRVKALYDLGTVLLQSGVDAKDTDALIRAGECFELCFKLANGDAALQADAEHNLELARLLWLKVRAEIKPPDEQGGSDAMPERRKNRLSKGGFNEFGEPIPREGTGDKSDNAQHGKDAPETENKMTGAGTVDVLADSDQLQSLDGADARDLLARIIQRIERDQAQGQGQLPLDNRHVKDW